MKKIIISIMLFLITFVAAYLIICFKIPGMRIKLDAEPMEYFIKSISHMAFFKTLVSLVAALIVGTIPLLVRKRK